MLIPGNASIGHLWAYLPDVAETMVQLLERVDALDTFAVFHMEGHWDADGTQMIAAIREASGNPDVKARPFPWRLMRMLSPFVPLFRELAEMRYLWTTPTHMGNDRLIKILGAGPRTPLTIAVRETLAGMGYLQNSMKQSVATTGEPLATARQSRATPG